MMELMFVLMYSYDIIYVQKKHIFPRKATVSTIM